MSQYLNLGVTSPGMVSERAPGVPIGGNGGSVDRSANAPAIAAGLAAIPANPQRAGFYIQNQSAVPLQVVLGNPSGAATIILVDPGAGANRQGADWSLASAGITFTGPIQICGATGAQFAALEF